MAQDVQKTILIVDDEEALREALVKILEDDGYEVIAAESGERAIEILHDYPVDLMLTDIRMPGMSGIDLLKKVREIHHTLGVIILTGYGEIESYIEAMHFGALEYVSKPFKMNELKFIVNKLLNNTDND